MLGIIAAILVAVWLLGIATANTVGGFIHVLLLLALILMLTNLLENREQTMKKFQPRH